MSVTTPDGYPIDPDDISDGMAWSDAAFRKAILDERADILDAPPPGWGDIKIYGDAHEQLDDLSIIGVTYANTDEGSLYYDWSKSGDTRTFSAYKDSAQAAGDLVLQGTLDADGEITLTEQNTSGLSGLVTGTYTVDDTGDDNVIRCSSNEVEIERLRVGKVYDEISRQLIKNPQLIKPKKEYIEALEDIDTMKNAELYCGLMYIYQAKMDGEEGEKARVMRDLYKEMLKDAMADDRIQFDMGTMDTITEDDEDDEPSGMAPYFRFAG